MNVCTWLGCGCPDETLWPGLVEGHIVCAIILTKERHDRRGRLLDPQGVVLTDEVELELENGFEIFTYLV